MAEISVIYLPDGTPDLIIVDGVTWRMPRVDAAGSQRVALDVDSDDYVMFNETYTGAETNNTLIAAQGTTERIALLGLQFSTKVAGEFKFTQSSGSPGDVYGPHFFPADSGMVIAPVRRVVLLNTNSALRITTDIAGDHTISGQAIVIE